MAGASYTRDEIAKINAVAKPREARCEILDNTTGEIWQAFEPHSRAWYEQLDLGPDFTPVGYAAAHIDRHWFRRSPELPEGWSLRTITPDEEWVIDLPAPTETYWFDGPVSYQGPVEAPG